MSENSLYQYHSKIASKCQDLARNLTYNEGVNEAKAKHLLLEVSHALDIASVKVHKKKDGLLIINARGGSRFMTWKERVAYWLLGKTDIIV